MVAIFEELCKGNMYTTTLQSINSSIIKMSKVMTVEKCYRGVKGGVLPQQFWHADSLKIRGGVEFGFTSTSLDRSVAMEYAGDPSGAATIIEMQTGMVDRGASLQWLSQ